MVLVHIRWGSEQKKTTGGLGLQFRLVFGPFRACFWPKLLISLHIVRKYFVVTKTVLRHCFWELGNETIGMVVLHDNVIKSEGWHFVCVIEGQNYRKIAKIAKRCLKNENTIKKKDQPSFFSHCQEEQPGQLLFPNSQNYGAKFRSQNTCACRGHQLVYVDLP